MHRPEISFPFTSLEKEQEEQTSTKTLNKGVQADSGFIVSKEVGDLICVST